MSLTPEELRTGACVLSPEVVSRLASVLEQHHSILSRDLGLSLNGPVDHELWAWCRMSGSTIFVLASVLESVGRQDCLTWLHNDMERHLMRLHVAIEGAPSTGQSSGGLPTVGADIPGQPQFQQVSTNSQFTIREALESSLGGDLDRFEIIGPESWVTWDSSANNLRGRMLTLRYIRGSQTSSMDSETQVKELYSTDDSTEVKNLYLHKNGTLSEEWSLSKDGKSGKREDFIFANSCDDKEEFSFSATHVKQVSGVDATQLKGLTDGDNTESKQLASAQYQTYVKEIYLDNSPQDVSFISCSNNATPMDSNVQRDGELGLSDSVIVEPRYSTFNMDTLNELCSNTTCKFPISRENMQGQLSDTKTLPNKDMSQGSLPVCPTQSSSHVNTNKLPQSLANVPNLSLLNPSSSGVPSEPSYRDRELSMAEMSHRSDLSPVERKQNNLNYISVSTAASLFRANLGTSLAEKPHLGHPEISHEDGDKSNSDNRILDEGDGHSVDAVDGRAVDDSGGGGNGHVNMEISDHQTMVKSVPERGAVVNGPPIKRQKSHNDFSALDGTHSSDNDGLGPRGDTNAVDEGTAGNTPYATVRESQPELDSEMVQHHQQDSISISQEPNHRLLPPTDNLYRHTPPPQYLVKQPPFPPPPYSSVAQNVSRQMQLTNPSITQFSSNSQPLFSNPQASRADKISYTNVPGHLSAPANLPSQHDRVPSSVHYVPMAVSDSTKAVSGAEFSPTSQFVSSHPHNQGMPLSRGVSATPRPQTSSSKFPQFSTTHTTQGPHAVQPRSARPDSFVSGISRPQIPPFQPAPLAMPVSRPNVLPSAAQQGQGRDERGRSHPGPERARAEVESEHYIYPDQAEPVGGAVAAQPRQPMRSGVSLEDELRELPGWCPDVNGDNIQEIMREYLHQDGAFIIWRSRRHNKFVITVSHQRNLVYLLVREFPRRSREGGPVYYLFQHDGVRTDSILRLYQHYRSHGIQMNITSQQGRQHREHIYLRGPIRVRITRRRRQ